MKVALCLSGQARSVEENFPNIKEKFLDRNDVDVFAHTWFDKSDLNKRFSGRDEVDTADGKNITNNAVLKPNTEDLIRRLYSPKKMLIEPQKAFIEENLAFREPAVSGDQPDNPYPNRWYIRPQWFLSMCYSIMESNRLKKEFEAENNFVYDCVIRLRFDMNFQAHLDLSKADLNRVYAMRHTHEGCGYSYHDTFGFSNSKNMDYYSSLFNKVDDYFKVGIEFCPEIMLGWHLLHGPFSIKNIVYPFEIVR